MKQKYLHRKAVPRRCKNYLLIPIPHHFSLESNPAGTAHLLAVQLQRWVLACAAGDSYLSASVGAGEDTPGCISEGREIR